MTRDENREGCRRGERVNAGTDRQTPPTHKGVDIINYEIKNKDRLAPNKRTISEVTTDKGKDMNNDRLA